MSLESDIAIFNYFCIDVIGDDEKFEFAIRVYYYNGREIKETTIYSYVNHPDEDEVIKKVKENEYPS